ncbi:CHAT domain-containing protein [Lactarius psammicola]|nr:CHAT domain-containing protein [Lactarius psammicola]
MAVPQLSINEIDPFLTDAQHLLSALPLSHPLRPACVYSLAMARFHRYKLSSQKDDLDKAILHWTESILQPWSFPEPKPNILVIFFDLAVALYLRSNESKQPESACYVTKYFRHLRDQPLEMFEFPRHRATSSLVDALALQVELGAGSVTQNIGEMAVLCCELLTTNTSDVRTSRAITSFAGAILSRVNVFVPDQPFGQLIECLRAAKKHKPDLHQAPRVLAICLVIRYSMTFENDDYEEAADVLDEIINSSSTGDSQDEFVAKAQWIVTTLAMIRSSVHETPEYSEEAIYRARAFISKSFVKEPFYPPVAWGLEDLAKKRSSYFGPIEGLEAAQTAPVMSLGEFGDEVSKFGRKLELLGELLSGIRNNDITEIDQAIEKGRSILVSPAPRFMLTPWLFEVFGKILFEGFKRTNKIGYLNDSIDTLRQVLERPSTQFLRFGTLWAISVSLVTRSVYFPGYRTQDLDEALELLSHCVNDGYASLPNRFQAACHWASVARRIRHPSVSTAYESAVSLMQDTLLFAPTLQLQHATLATSEDTHRIPLDYASYQVDLHQLEGAIETLERGRALLWSEMRHFRASIDQLLQTNPQLGQEFAAVNRDLEELTKSIPPSHKLSIDDNGADDLRAADPFGRLLLKQRSLLNERDKLISQIQALPGFDSFLTSPSFDTLRSAACRGPVIIINHSEWGSGILILLQDASPSVISTPRSFYDRASTLKDKLLGSRHKYGLDSSHHDETLAFVLAELYNLVGKPVINRLHQLKVPEHSRIWWCPTSVFCSLPLHAMGPIPSDDGEKRYFLDHYICSYTPTLSALIQSRNRDPGLQTSDRPSLLLVAQPDPSLPTVGGEIQVVQALDTEVTSLISEAATPAAVIDSFRHHQLVHFACHGTLEAGKPFEAGFELYGGERLTLLEIVRSDLPTAEFAFLSACHTAEMTEGSIVDEGLHLAAAVQYCGFRSVVGTMWAMVDEDGRDLAKHFYKALFSTLRREEGVRYHERSAKALRFAVKKLRGKRGMTLERWVNFVHYGA